MCVYQTKVTLQNIEMLDRKIYIENIEKFRFKIMAIRPIFWRLWLLDVMAIRRNPLY